ncbi:MAG: TonB-dependent receptor, partial [Saprospiraceae bacterium]|nr:TonB-dependent receptor [Saprospiraceae bacterium]
MGRRLITYCILSLLCCVSVQGQNASAVLRGTVIDGLSGAPLPYVNISVDHAALGAVSLPNGTYLVTGLDTGLHRLVVSCIGYRSLVDSVRIGADIDTLIFDVTLRSTYVLTDEIQVTASSKTNSVHLAPASAVVLNAESIRQRQIQTFDQALDDVTGVTVTRSGGANVQSLSIRGASETAGGGIGNRVLLLIDGRPSVSPESGGALWNLVPLHALERIEVVKGAYSALFGSSAMGGVIQAITRRPAEASDTRAYVNVGFYDKAPGYTDYDRRGAFHTVGLSRSHRHGRFGYLFDIGRTRNDGHRQKSAYELHNLFTKVTYDLTGNRSLSLSVNVNDMFNDTPASWLSSLDPYRVAEHRKDDFQDRQEVSADAVYRAFT